MSAGNIRYGQHLLRSAASSGEAELYVACVATDQATETMAREMVWDLRLDAMELQVGACAAVGIFGRQGLENVRHLDLSCWWLLSAVRRKQITHKTVQVGKQHGRSREGSSREGNNGSTHGEIAMQ